MELFQRTGYDGTSTNDLAGHLGIGKASLYATFGSKHDLYVQALRRYNETASEVAANWNAIEVALTTTLTRARAEGEIPAEKDPRTLARFLLVFLQGVQVVARGEPDTKRLGDAAHAALDALTA